MLRKVVFQLHWLLGIAAAVILAIVGVTGAMLSFEEESLHLLNRDVLTVPAQGNALSPAHLLEVVRRREPERRVANITVYSDPTQAARVTFTAKPSSGQPRPRGETWFVNPYDGAVLGKRLRGQETLRTIERIHRGMVAGDMGRALVGASTLMLVVLAISGLYLRWPKSGGRRWQTWFKLHTNLKGRALLWHLHSLIGTWVLPLYLLASLTGLYFAYDWYRQGVIATLAATPPNREAPKLAEPARGDLALAKVWETFTTLGAFESATLVLPQTPERAVEIRALPIDAQHERAFDRIALHPVTGDLLKHDRFADRSVGNKIVGGILPLHTGSFFSFTGKIIMLIASLAMPLFAITGWMLYLRRRRSAERMIATAQPVFER